MAIDIIVQNSLLAEARNSNDELIGSGVVSAVNNIIEIPDIDLLIKDQNNNNLLTSVEKSGVNLTKTVNVASQADVSFKYPTPMQIISYRTGDEGYRNANNLILPSQPPYPKAFAELDFSIGVNGYFKIKNPLAVGGVANTLRFTDLNGVQLWGATNNVDKITIDKLTGIGFLRAAQGSGLSWNDHIDNAMNYSIVANGITLDNFFMISMPEAQAIFNYVNYAGKGIDPTSGKYYFFTLNDMFVSTTYFPSTTNAYLLTETWGWSALGKTNTTKSTVYVFDARSLITAP